MSDWFVPHDLEGPIAGAAEGPLAGMRVAVKDSYDVAGARTGAGSPEWLAEQEPAPAHAAAVRRLLAAGAAVVGKTICDELFFSITGVSAHYGTPTNTRAPGRIPGGSSSGSAAATSGGACDIGLGTDTGGSIRAPSAFCGLFGLRPTHGRVDLAGCVPMAPSFDVGGWMARDAGTLAAVGPVLLDSADTVPGPVERVVVAEDAFPVAEDAVAAAVLAVIDRSAAKRVSVAPGGFDPWREAFRVVQGFEVWQTFGAFVERAQPALGPGVRERIAYSSSVTGEQVDAARAVAAEARTHLRSIARPGTVIALPTVPCVAAPVDIGGAALEELRTRTFRLMCLAGLAGLPQISMPAGTVDGCPVGLSLIGWPGGDEALLALAVDRQHDLAGGAA